MSRLLFLLLLAVILYAVKSSPHESMKYVITGNGEKYETTAYEREKNGCLVFEDYSGKTVHLCGTTTIYTNPNYKKR